MIWFRRDRLACQDFVEMVTDYLDGAMSTGQRAKVERHLKRCPGCDRTLAQWRAVIDLAGRLEEVEVERLDLDTRDELFRAFRRARGG